MGRRTPDDSTSEPKKYGKSSLWQSFMSLCATRKARKCADSDSTAPPVPRYRRIFEGGLAIVDSLAGAEADVDPAHGFRAGAATLARTMAFPASRLCLRDSQLSGPYLIRYHLPLPWW